MSLPSPPITPTLVSLMVSQAPIAQMQAPSTSHTQDPDLEPPDILSTTKSMLLVRLCEACRSTSRRELGIYRSSRSTAYLAWGSRASVKVLNLPRVIDDLRLTSLL